MAEIYLAEARALHGFQKLVVLKRVLPQYAENRDFMRMFLDEAKLAATLDHPNIVQVYDIGGHNGNFFFAMEYIHGQSLLRVMRQITTLRRWLPLEHALAIIIGTCGGLHHAHEKLGRDGKPLHIVHRDVSPPNILLSYDGAVKVADFGIAKATTASVATQVGTLKGKIPYMSPEQCRSEALDRRSDVFSIGILLYELTVGRRLYHAETEIGIMHKIVSGAITPPSEVLRGYPRELEQIVFRALESDLNRRYPTSRALQIDLEEFAREYKISISSARLASFMEELFDADTRRWPDPHEATDEESVSSLTGTGHQAVSSSGVATAGGVRHNTTEIASIPPVPAPPQSAEAGGSNQRPTLVQGGRAGSADGVATNLPGANPSRPQAGSASRGATVVPPHHEVAAAASAANAAPASSDPYNAVAVAAPAAEGPAAPPPDISAFDAALSRMLDSDLQVDGLTADLGEPRADPQDPDSWFGLDSLELEDLDPAKQQRR